MAIGTTLARLNVLIGADLSELQDKLKGAQASLRSAGQQMSQVGRGLTRNVTAPIVGIGAGAIAASEQVQNGLRTIRRGTGATGDSLAGLEADFRALAGTIPASMDQVGTAIADLNTRTGATGETLQDLARQSINLARVTGEDLGNVIRTSTRLFGDWGVAVEDQAESLNDLFRISQRTGIGVGRLSDVTTTFGVQLRAIGLDLDQAAAMLGQWERAGVASEKILGGLSIGVRKLGEMAEEQGITTAEAFVNLREAIKGATQEQAVAIATQVFGARSGTDMALAIREGRLEFEQFAEALAGGGDTIAAAAAETRTFGESMQMLGQRLMLAAEPLGTAFVEAFDRMQPMIERVIGVVARVVSAFGNLPGPVQAAIVAVAGLAAALGPVLVVLGFVAQGIAAALPLLAPLGAAIAGISAPVALAVAAVVALGVAIFKFRNEIGSALGTAAGAARSALAPLVPVFEALWEVVKAGGALIGAVLAPAIDLLVFGFRTWWAVAQPVLRLLGGVFLEGLRQWSDAVVAAAEIVSRVLVTGLEQWRESLELMTGFFQAARQRIGEIVAGLVAAIRDHLLGRLGQIFDGVRQQVDRVAGFFRDLKDRVVGNSFIPEMVDGIGRQMGRLNTVMVDPARDAVDATIQQFARLPAAAEDAAGGASAALGTITADTDALDRLIDGLERQNRELRLSASELAEYELRVLGATEAQRQYALYLRQSNDELARQRKIQEDAARAVEAAVESARRVRTEEIAARINTIERAAERMAERFADAFTRIGEGWRSLVAATAQAVRDILLEISRLLAQRFFSQILGSFVSSVSIPAAPGPLDPPAPPPGFQRGGRPPRGKLAVVGEAGPELFVPDQAGTVLPADVTAGLMSARPSPEVIRKAARLGVDVVPPELFVADAGASEVGAEPRQRGGRVRRLVEYLVGEVGPELFVPERRDGPRGDRRRTTSRSMERTVRVLRESVREVFRERRDTEVAPGLTRVRNEFSATVRGLRAGMPRPVAIPRGGGARPNAELRAASGQPLVASAVRASQPGATVLQTVEFHLHAIDGPSARQFLRQNAGEIARIQRESTRRSLAHLEESVR